MENPTVQVDEGSDGILDRLKTFFSKKPAGDQRSRLVHVIINPAAGFDQPILKTLNLACQMAEVDWEVFITKQSGDGRRLAQAAIKAGASTVVVHGGDGSVMEAASGLIGSQVPLAIIPGGTANVFSKELGIPADTVEACALAVSAPEALRQVDMGQIDSHYFLLRASVGFEAAVIEGAPRELKDRYGIFAYGISAIQALAEPQMARYQVNLDGKEIETEGLTCIIANSGATGSPLFTLSPSILIDDGLLDVLVVRKSDFASLLSLAASVVGGVENVDVMDHWQARTVQLNSDPSQVLQVDGEMLGQTPVTAKVLPQAVSMIVPAPPENNGA